MNDQQSRKLNIHVNLDTGQLERGSQSAVNTLKGIGDEAEIQGKRMVGVFQKAGMAIAGAFALQRIKDFFGEMVNVRSEIQSLNVSFNTLLGNEQRAAALMSQIRTFAANTPMQMGDLAQGAQTLLGFNVEAKKVMPILQSIGDISMGDAQKFNSLTLAFAQMSSTGKLMGQDLLQMINAGFNPLMVISEKTGKSISTLKDEMAAGSISAQMVEDAFRAATAEGGKFYGMLEAQSKTLRGSISNLQGAFTDMLNDFGESSEGLIAGGVNATYQMVKNYKTTAEALLALIATVGVYKAAVIANEAIEAAAIDTLHTKMAAIAEVQAAQATGLELEVQQAVAKGTLTKAEGEEILANYELAKARVADLAAIKAQTQLEYQASIVARDAASTKVAAAEAQVLASNAKYEAALKSGNMERIERAELALYTAQSELNAASKAHMAAMTDVATASKKASAAATAADTAQQQLNTISMTAGSKAAGFLTLAKTQLRNAVAKLYATMTAHPFAMLLAAVVALGYGIYKLCTYTSQAEKAQIKLKESYAQAEASAAQEEREVKKLFDALKKAKEGTEAYKKAKEDIWLKYGKYLKSLGDENTALKDQAAAYALVAKKAREAAMAKMKDQFMDSDEAKNWLKKVGEARQKAYELVKSKYGEKFANDNKEAIARIISGDANVNQEFLKKFNQIEYRQGNHSVFSYEASHAVTVNALQSLIDQGKKAMAEYDELEKQAEIMFGAAEDPGDGAAEISQNYAQTLAAAKKARDEAKTKWEELKKSTTSTVKEVQAAEKAYESAKKTYEDLEGKKNTDKQSGKTPAEIAAEKVAALQKETDLEIRHRRERNQKLLELDAELEQARINVMEEGAAKRERQRQLDMANEIADIQARMNADIEAEINRQKALFDAAEEAAAAGKKGYAKKTFSAGSLMSTPLTATEGIPEGTDTGNVKTAEIQKIIAKYKLILGLTAQIRAKANQDELEADRLAMSEYLKDFGTYEEKKTAIAELYAKKREKATSDAERMRLYREEKKATDDLDFDDFINTKAAMAFGDISNLTQESIAGLIKELEKYRDKVTETFDPEKIQKFNDALSELRRAQAMNENNLLAQIIPSYFRERRATQYAINDAEKAHNKLLEEKAEKEREVKRRIEEIIAKVKELTGTELSAQQVNDGSTLNNIIGQLGQQGGNQQGASDLSSLINDLGKARTELGGVTQASNKAGNTLGQLKETFSSKFSGQGGTLAMIDTIIHGINDIVQGANETVNELKSTADALGADTEVGSGWDKAATFMGAFAQASEGATQAWDSLKSGNIMGVVSGVTKSITSWIKGFAAIHDASRERTIQRLQEQIEDLDRENRRIEHRLKGEYSKAASESYKEEVKNLERQRSLIQQQIAAENDKKNPDDDRIQEWKDQWEELGRQAEEYKDKVLDAILGEDISSTIDNFTDALADSWGKTGERARATKDLVKSMLKQMVLEAMKTDLTEPIRKLREMMSKALDDDVVTEAEQKELEAFAQQLATETERKYKWADNIIKGTDNRQSGATSGTFATASQDSVTELSGRAAAIHTSGEMRRELLAGISGDIREMKLLQEAKREEETEIRGLVFLAVGHLETIARNTNELYEMNERLGKIEKNTSNL